MTSNAEIVASFLKAFMSGDIDRASQMVSEDFSFRASLQDGAGNKAAYFAGARDKARFLEAFRILHQWEDGDEVSTIYELDIHTKEGAATVPMSEWHKVRNGKIASTFMIFNGNAKGVHLMRDALGGHG